MKFPLLSLALMAAILCGCSSVQYYEVAMKQPNPFSTRVLRSQKKPQLKSESVVRFRDEKGQQFQIEADIVKGIKPPPPNPSGDPDAANSKYQIILSETNRYGVQVAFTPEKPVRVTHRYYLIKRMDGRPAKIAQMYVTSIEPRKKKYIYETIDPTFTEKFDFR